VPRVWHLVLGVLSEVGLAAALEVGAFVVRAVGVRRMHELLALVLLASAWSVKEMRSGMALRSLAVALAAANPTVPAATLRLPCRSSPRSQPSYRHVVFFAAQIPL